MKKQEVACGSYLAPLTRVQEIDMEHSFLGSTAQGQLGEMDPNELFDEDF